MPWWVGERFIMRVGRLLLIIRVGWWEVCYKGG